MKKYLIFCLILLGILFAPAVLAEQINSFDVTIDINQDSSINVTEIIEYDFENLQRHGIFRTIPIKYRARGGNYNLRISNVSVTDENYQPYNYRVSYPGSDMEIKIGDADKYITGQHTYVINYTIKRAFNYFEDYDELYWNVTGTEWPVPINDISAEINLPQAISDVKTACFSGSLGSTEPCDQTDLSGRRVLFSHDQLDTYAGVSLVIGLPKGVVAKPAVSEILVWTIFDNWVVVIPIIVFLICYYYWFKHGKDPRGKGTVIAQFDPPDRLSPAEVGTLYDNKIQGKDVSAEIINLAIKGWLKINRTEKGKIFKSVDYQFERLKELDSSQLSDIEWDIMVGLFESNGEKKSVKLSDLKNKFYVDFAIIRDKIWKFLTKQGYYPENYKSAGSVMIVLGIVGIVASISAISLFIMYLGFYLLGSLIVSFIIIIIFGAFMPKITKKGAITKEYIEGLKLYLTVAEKDRLKFHNAPAKNPQEFERLLPYAIVLGVETEWAEQFKDIYKEQPPNWYSDPNIQGFNALNIANGLSGFKTASAAGLTSSPSSSSSSGSAGGFSGFSSGGGFSGGGFGGGGGGSW